MSTWQKMAIGIASALVVGLVAGYVLGISGKSSLEVAVAQAKRAAAAAKQAAQQTSDELQSVRKEQRRSVALLRVKEELLRGLVQMHANNFGLASQHLGSAAGKLKQARALVDAATQRRIDAILGEISQAHTVAMSLDPMVRVRFERLVELVHGLPGAR